MRRVGLLFFALSLYGCTGTTDKGESCTATIDALTPDEGDSGVNANASLEVVFSEADKDATFTLTGGAGEMTTDVTWVGSTAVLWPQEELGKGTWTLSVAGSCASAEVAFTVGEGGGVDTDGGDTDTDADTDADTDEPSADVLVGRTWIWPLEDATIEPVELADLVGDELAGQAIWIDVVAVDTTDDTVDLRFAIGSTPPDPEQDLCTPTTDLPGADFSAPPLLTASTNTAAFDVGGATVNARAFELSTRLGFDGDSANQGSVSFELDGRELGPALGVPGALVCGILEAAGVVCGDCVASAAETCFMLSLSGMSGPDDPDEEVVRRTSADVAGDATCQD